MPTCNPENDNPMPLYKIFDIVVDCDILIPELPPLVDVDRLDIRISSGDQKVGDIIREAQCIHEWKDEEGETTMSCGRYGEDYVLSFLDNADFLISTSSRSIYYFAHPQIPMVTLRHILLDQVLPRFLAHQGHLVLHASGICLPDGRGIAFLGPSGAGKSTLAASFFEHGAHFLTDDCLLLRATDANVMGVASYRGLRLYDDSRYATVGAALESWKVAHYTDKRRIHLDQDETKEDAALAHIDTLFILREDEVENVRISQVYGMQPVMDLVSQLFVLDATDTNTAMHNLRAVTQLLNSGLSIYNINYPREFSFLDQVLEGIGGEIGIG